MITLETLPWPLALVDASGRIVATNAKWRDVDAQHRFAGSDFAVGDEYAAACDALDTVEAKEIALGTRAVLAGTARELETSYRSGETRLFRLTVTPHEHEGTRGALICSSEISALRDQIVRGEGFFRAIVDASVDITTVLGHDGGIVFESASLERLLGYSPGDVLGQSAFAYVHPEDVPRVVAMFAEAVAEPRSTRSLTLRLRHKDGRYRHFDANATNRLDDATVAGIVVTSRDVTDRVEAEERLKSVQTRLAGILEATEDGIISVDSAQRVSMFNEGAERVFGYHASEVLGESLAKLLPPRVAAAHDAHVRGFSKSGEHSRRMAERSRVLGRRKDGSEFHAEVSISRFDVDGERVLTAFVRDTTTRERAAEALRESQNRLRTVVEGAPILLFAMDREGTFTLSEGKALESLGLTPGQVVGSSALTLYKDVPGFAETFERALAGEVVHLASTVGPVAFEAVYSPLRDESLRVIGVTGVAFDVSERKRLEAQLLHAQRMESIGRLAGGVAHDFNNLLTVILGGAEMLEQSLPAGDEGLVDVEQIVEAGRRAADLTSQLLAFARKQIISPNIVDLGHNLARVKKILGRLIGEDIEIVTTVQANLDPVLVDATQFDQIILNLAINARDAMPDGGRLTLGLANVILGDDHALMHGGATPGPHVRLTVSDTGSGIDSDVLAQVFEPFFTTKPPGLGTGLGLATCYGSVRQAGGHMSVESEAGKGTTFSVYVPSAVGSVAALAAQPAPTTRPHRGETILLVEDDSLVRALAARSLRAGGFEVLVAESASKALAIAHETPSFDLLVTDVVMPGMRGSELAAKLRAERPCLPVLFVSGYTETATVRTGLDEGVAFLAKPFTPTSLLRQVHEMLPDEGSSSRAAVDR